MKIQGYGGSAFVTVKVIWRGTLLLESPFVATDIRQAHMSIFAQRPKASWDANHKASRSLVFSRMPPSIAQLELEKIKEKKRKEKKEKSKELEPEFT